MKVFWKFFAVPLQTPWSLPLPFPPPSSHKRMKIWSNSLFPLPPTLLHPTQPQPQPPHTKFLFEMSYSGVVALSSCFFFVSWTLGGKKILPFAPLFFLMCVVTFQQEYLHSCHSGINFIQFFSIILHSAVGFEKQAPSQICFWWGFARPSFSYLPSSMSLLM